MNGCQPLRQGGVLHADHVSGGAGCGGTRVMGYGVMVRILVGARGMGPCPCLSLVLPCNTGPVGSSGVQWSPRLWCLF